MPAKEEQEQQQQQAPEQVEAQKPDPRDAEIADMKLSLHQLSSNLDNTIALLSKTVQGNQVAPVAQEPEVTDEELEQALLSGTGAAATVRRLLKAQEKRLLETHITPLREQGMSSIAGLTQKLAEGEMPYYKEYKKEIDGYVQTLAPELRLNPQAYVLAHNAVVGSHLEEIMAKDRSVKARQAAQEGGLEPGVGGVRKQEKGSGVPGPRDLGGEEAVAALQVLGQDENQFARKLGYQSWEDYMKKTEEYA